MTNYNYVISIAGTTTVHYDTETRLVSTLGIFSFSKTARFKSQEDAEKHAQNLINQLKNNPEVTKQELQYVTSKPWSVIEFSKNLCVNCQESRVYKEGFNRCLRCSYM